LKAEGRLAKINIMKGKFNAVFIFTALFPLYCVGIVCFLVSLTVMDHAIGLADDIIDRRNDGRSQQNFTNKQSVQGVTLFSLDTGSDLIFI
jgi:hypothetical protein